MAPLPAAPAGAGEQDLLAGALASSTTVDGQLIEIRRSLGADTATLLMLDPGRTMLEHVASVGLDRTSRTSIRVPVGRGFAGRIAETGAPYTLTEVTDRNVLNPVLRAHAIRSLTGVPVRSAGRVIGVLHVGQRARREFTDTEVVTLEQAADRLAEVLRATLVDQHHRAALVLQRSLLPTAPIPVPGLDLAARYVPAEGDLGGDWYDVFQLPDGRVGIVMGDVVGHGLHAAVIMGRLRSSLRSYALETDDPAEVLRRLDRKILHFERGALATVLYGVLEHPYDSVTLSSAGHLPPLLAVPGEPSVQVELPHDMLLGALPGAERHSTRVALPPGAALCLFTDGLVERRATSTRVTADRWAELDAVLERFTASMTADFACSRLLHDTIGDDIADDDIALLILRRTDADPAD